jgi:histidine phosphotransferase ChpT
VKLLLNLFLVAYGSIPRGGNIDVVLENPDLDAKFTITTKGRLMRVPPKFAEICSGTLEEAVDAHSVQPYYTVLLADESGMELSYKATPEELTFIATMRGE